MLEALLTGERKPPQQAARPSVAREKGEVYVKNIPEDMRVIAKPDGGGVFMPAKLIARTAGRKVLPVYRAKSK